jgi:hypothetical protein
LLFSIGMWSGKLFCPDWLKTMILPISAAHIGWKGTCHHTSYWLRLGLQIICPGWPWTMILQCEEPGL